MIASNSRIGWQTTLADLALILFMVTAAAMAERPEVVPPPAPPAVADTPVPASGEPLAIYRLAPGAPSLADWLAGQPRDPRQHLTIIARHPAGDAAAAVRAALALEREARAAGRNARIVVEPAAGADVIAVLDFDGRRSGTPVAREDASVTGAASSAANQR